MENGICNMEFHITDSIFHIPVFLYSNLMSRHSKWSKVKQFKGAIDAKRSASFTKLAREITVAAREKGPDVSYNFRLRTAIDRAKEASMPKESIDRAVQRGAGGGEEGLIESLTYEGYGPGGVALIIECLTDNRNRSANDVKHMLTKHGGSLATPGSVLFQFDRKGVVIVTGEIELDLIDAGATDIVPLEGDTEILCGPNDVQKVSDAAVRHHLTVASAATEWIPKNTVELNDTTSKVIDDLISALDELDDVQQVTTT
jgi:YebC/PmpR family DNA-binding regulatory protein